MNHEHSNSAIVACIGLSFNLNEVEIGTFSVDPSLQNTGIGKTILSFAEEQALLIQPNLEGYAMYVLDVRTELVAYYQRRGYQLTELKIPYPIEANVGQPLRPIELHHMLKTIR